MLLSALGPLTFSSWFPNPAGPLVKSPFVKLSPELLSPLGTLSHGRGQERQKGNQVSKSQVGDGGSLGWGRDSGDAARETGLGVHCGLLRNDSGHQHRGDCLQDRQWDVGALFSFLILSSSRATSSSYAASRLVSLHFGSSLPLSLVTRFPGGPHTSEGPEALCYVDVSFSMVLS